LCDDAEDADLCGRIASRRRPALSAAACATTAASSPSAATAASGRLPGWNDGPVGHAMPDGAASGELRRRARLISGTSIEMNRVTPRVATP